ncbi:MAG TPA: hypothetical protein VMJ30_01610 [Gemmatimonadales bacterium]|nr:hypothetical protein [Gemmatimonadales bacterium]
MIRNHLSALTALAALTVLAACGGSGGETPVAPAGLSKVAGDHQSASRNATLASDLVVQVNSESAQPVSGAHLSWFVPTGGGTPSSTATTTNSQGQARVQYQLGAGYGLNVIGAALEGSGDTVYFNATAKGSITPAAGGNNVPERFSSDLTVHGDHAYTGTWNWYPRTAGVDVIGGTIVVFHLDGSGAPTRGDSIVINGTTTLSDLQVSDDGKWLVASTEGGSLDGLYVYDLTDPAHPAFVARYLVDTGLHTSQLATINGKLYAFTAKNPANPALVIFDLSQLAADTIIKSAQVAIPANYGLHDSFVRDGIAFEFAWNTGVMIYDVGNGMSGGSPTNPVLISTTPTNGGQAHNGWWFWGPGGAKQYLFVGQEGPGSIGSSSSGDIHVLDVSNLASPKEVAFFHIDGAGPHNFWMDETRQILYAAYYNAGVVALDVSGTLSGDLSDRLIARLQPAGNGNTYVWGVQLVGSSLYDVDMLDGFRQLTALAP